MDPRLKRKIFHHASFIGAIWSMLFGVVQLIVLGLSYSDLNEKRYHQDHMELPFYGGGVDPYRQSMPGLYNRYVNMPERRRIMALFIMHISLMILAAVFLLLSFLLVYGVLKRSKNFIWPWFPLSCITSFIQVAYAIVWWAGDCFRMWKTISMFEFVSAVPVNAIVLAIVFIYYLNLVDYFEDSDRRAASNALKYSPGELTKSNSHININMAQLGGPAHQQDTPIMYTGYITGPVQPQAAFAPAPQHAFRPIQPAPDPWNDPAGPPMGGPPRMALPAAAPPPQPQPHLQQQPQMPRPMPPAPMYQPERQMSAPAPVYNEPPPQYTPRAEPQHARQAMRTWQTIT